jgi:hypothetical protein
MTHQQWQSSTDPEPMLRTLPADRYQRELRLFCVACVRRVSHLLPDPCRQALDTAQQFAHGTASEAQLRAALDAATPVINALWSGGRSPDAIAYATQAAGDAASASPRTPATVLSTTTAAASALACTAAESDPANYDATFDTARTAELAAQAALLRKLIPHLALD